MIKILVIGSNGFIGSHCINYFSAQRYQVIGCDIHELNKPSYISLKSTSFEEVFKACQYDFCINAAGSAYVNYSFEHPEKDFELNVSLVINLLGAIKNYAPDCKLINFSSAAVYGNPTILPISEDAVASPLSPYGYHKLLSENLLLEYYRFFNLKTCSLRIFSAYGEGLKKQLFWDLYKKIPNKGIISLYGTGAESRDFIYILDIVNIIDIIMKKAEFKGEVYNVANGEELFIREVATEFYNVMDRKVQIAFSGEEKIGDPINWRADIKKIKSMGYVQKYSFAEGIKRHSKWLKSLK